MSNPLKYKRIFASSSGTGGMTPAELTRLQTLENNEIKVAYFTEINSNTGTIVIPTGATILLDQFSGGVDALVSTISTGQPTGKNPVTAGAAIVDVASFDASGNYTLTGIPNAYPVALVYILKIDAKDWSNLTTANILEWENYTYTGTAPLVVNANTRVISMQQAGPLQDGYLTSIDWTNFDDKADVSQVQSGTDKYAVATGTDTYVATLSPVPTAYATGNSYWIKIPNTNTVTNPTLNINSLGAKTIKGANGVALPIGQFVAGGNYQFVYDGTDFILQAGMMDRKDLSYYRKTGTANYERWYSSATVSQTFSTVAKAKDVLTVTPFIVSKTITFDRIAMDFTAGGDVGSLVRLGIYADNGNLYPGALVLDAGTLAGDSTAAQSITINQTLTPGLYWLAFNHNSTANITMRAMAGTGFSSILGNPLSIGAGNSGTAVTVASVYGTLPNPFPAGAAVITGTTPIITVRLSA